MDADQTISPCWETLGCPDGKQKTCPATEAWSEGKHCFEVADTYCRKVIGTIRNKGAINDCKDCLHFLNVSNMLPEGEAIRRLVDARLALPEDEDQYLKDRAAVDIEMESREAWAEKYRAIDDPR